MKQTYNKEWFKVRAIDNLRKIAKNTWDYSDSALLYLSSGSDAYEQLQVEKSPYFKQITEPETHYLKEVAEPVIALLPDHVDFVDLGPGTEHKEQFFFDELKRQKKTFSYIPVDISESFLDIATTYATQQGIEVTPIHASFEEVPDILAKRTSPRFVSLGLTWQNYEPSVILALLERIAEKDGWYFLTSHIRDRINVPILKKIYGDILMADEKMKLIGLDPRTDVSPRSIDDEFRVWCTINHVSGILKEKGVEEGDRLLVFQSMRYTKAQLQDILSATSHYQLLDNGSAFIGIMARS